MLIRLANLVSNAIETVPFYDALGIQPLGCRTAGKIPDFNKIHWPIE